LQAVREELRLLAQALGNRRQLSQMHWGGGTPTYLSPRQCQELFAAVTEHFSFLPGAEIALEVDPCVTTPEHLRVLRGLGFNRISMGLQDLNPQVQQAVRRVQSLELTKALVDLARELGFVSVNLDLMYGLPYQTPASFRETAEKVVQELSPDRVAIFSYAHVPWIKPHQKALEALPLPRGFSKFQIFAAAAQVFLQAGYRFIGMDHFAKPEDELSRALDRGNLHRNFMGYTVLPATDLVGVGITSIGDVGGAYVQNEKNLARYQRAVQAGQFAVERGLWRSAEDELRGAVIRKLICTFTLPFAWVRSQFGVEPQSYFARELEELQPFVEDGLLRLDQEGITVLPQGRLFIRNICMPFDTYLRREEGQPIYSRTI
jgi:oxygen-independent coproporphyrinogen-3 oxidase